MALKVLIEGNDLRLEFGTGIATYARVLGATLREGGHVTEVLVGTEKGINTKDPLLAEVQFYDAQSTAVPRWVRNLGTGVSVVAGATRGYQPSVFTPADTVVDAAKRRLVGFSRVHTVRDLKPLADTHFKVTGRPLLIRPDICPDLFHITQAIPLIVRGCANIMTIHDLIPLRLPSATLDEKKTFLNVLRNAVARCDHIITVSEHTRRDVVTVLGAPENKVTNTYQSVDMPPALLARSQDQVADELANSFRLEIGNYFLFVGAIEPKKNVSRLVDAYASSGSKRPLIIVGPPAWQYERDMAKIGNEQFMEYAFEDGRITPRRKVRRLEYLPLPRLVSLMRGARAVLFPSLYEGFGLPVAEAMLAGAPVMTSNVSSLPEVAGDAALLVDPHDVDAMADAIRTLDRDDDLCRDLVEKGRRQVAQFSRDKYRERLQAVYAKVLR